MQNNNMNKIFLYIVYCVCVCEYVSGNISVSCKASMWRS